MHENLESKLAFKPSENERNEDFSQFRNHEPIDESRSEIPKVKNYQEVFAMSLLSIILVTALVSSGMATGYPAVLVPQLKNESGSLHTDEEMGTWIASVPAITNILGAIVGGILMDFLGRKLTLQIQTVITASAWLCILLCKNHALLIIGRLLGGLASCVGFTAGQVYIAEVSSPSMRGFLGNIPFATASFGILVVFILGSIINWRLTAGIAIIPPVLAAFMYFIVPDSPDWLIRHGHIKRAQKACFWLRGNDTIRAEKEIQLLVNKFEQEKQNQKQDKLSVWTLLGTAQVLKPLIFMNLFNLLHILSGWMILILYAVEIISYMEMKNISEYTAAIICAGVRFVFNIAAMFTIGFIGRRPVGISTSACTALSSLSIAISLYFNIGKNYFMMFCLFLYVASSTIGFAALPTVLTGELFPSRARAAGGSIVFLTSSLLLFIYAKLFTFLKNLLGITGMFFLFGISSMLASVLLYITLPETKNKTLLEIEDYYCQDNILWIKRKIEKNLNKEEQTRPINVSFKMDSM